MGIELREPKSAEEFRAYYDLRWRILREPWAQARESAQDEHEHDAFHVMAFDENKGLVGVGRLHLNSPGEGQVRYMAIEKGHEGHGIGSLILEELETHARQLNVNRIVLNARENAIPFYRKRGYALVQRTSTLFESLIHWWMEKQL